MDSGLGFGRPGMTVRLHNEKRGPEAALFVFGRYETAQSKRPLAWASMV
ncbi:MAG: hypothetical protein K0S35_2732 [Geminicoccaceae bacterium]|nr:hypothetical protein [Geminicoccaceae bacterium]